MFVLDHVILYDCKQLAFRNDEEEFVKIGTGFDESSLQIFAHDLDLPRSFRNYSVYAYSCPRDGARLQADTVEK